MFWSKNSYFCLTFLISIISDAKLESCPDVKKLNVPIGMGWNALTNGDTKPLTRPTYDQCKLTSDGKFLIPDNTFDLAVGLRENQATAEIYEHWSDSIPPPHSIFKVATDVWPKQFLPLYHSFSFHYQNMKKTQVKYKAVVCSSELRFIKARIHSESDAPMIDAVKERFLQVIRAVVGNKDQEARHLAEKIVNDYGTHYTRNFNAGVMTVKYDFLRSDFVRAHESNRSQILSASKLTDSYFRDVENLDASLVSEYNEAIYTRRMWNWAISYGNLAAFDRSGDFLSSLLSSSHFPRAPGLLLNKTRQVFNDVIRDYYTRNIHRGCTLPKASNFDYAANLDDGSCVFEDVIDNYIFGGIYTTIEGHPYNTNLNRNQLTNSITKKSACPPNFQPQLFYTMYEFDSVSNNSTKEDFFSCTALFANLSTGSSSLLFGGLYSTHVNNSETKRKSCPTNFSPIRLRSEELVICVMRSNNFVARQSDQLPFGGFATLHNEYQCPIGHKKYLAAKFGITISHNSAGVDYGNLYYCLQENGKNIGVVPTLNRFSKYF